MAALGDHSEPIGDLKLEGGAQTETAPPEPPAPAWHQRPAIRTGALILAVLTMLVLIALLFPSRYWRF